MVWCYETMTIQLKMRQLFIGSILVMYCIRLQQVKPYVKKFDSFNRIDLIVNIILFYNVYISFTIQAIRGRENYKEGLKYITILVNMILIIYLAYHLIKIIYIAKIKPHVDMYRFKKAIKRKVRMRINNTHFARAMLMNIKKKKKQDAFEKIERD